MIRHLSPALVLIAARAWVGTPWMPRGSLRDVGADCAGLVRGVLRDLTGIRLPVPPWEAGGAGWEAAILAAAARAGFARRRGAPGPGDVILYRIGRRAHLGISTGAGVIHADTMAGVVEVPGPIGREIVAAWSWPLPDGLDPAPEGLTADDLLAIVMADPPPAAGMPRRVDVEVIPMIHPAGSVIARLPRFGSVEAALDYIAPWGIQSEVM